VSRQQSSTSPDPPPKGEAANEQFWRDYLENYSRAQAVARPIFSRLPTSPRCQLCGSPFHGFGGRLMRAVGKAQSTANPRTCNQCEKVMLKHHGGAEVPGSMLFADIRGSTAMAERMTPGEFHDLLDRFASVASATVFAHNGFVDKFIGDEVVAVFAPVFGADHAKRAVDAGLDLLRATGHGDPGGPWVPVGAGVHTGNVWFGAVGDAAHAELTVVGDPVNVTARLAAQAETGELLVSTEAAAAAGVETASPRRVLELKGKQDPFEVVTLRVGPSTG
jgi:adenylate cyclase